MKTEEVQRIAMLMDFEVTNERIREILISEGKTESETFLAIKAGEFYKALHET